jgi:hypothetical protein
LSSTRPPAAPANRHRHHRRDCPNNSLKQV